MSFRHFLTEFIYLCAQTYDCLVVNWAGEGKKLFVLFFVSRILVECEVGLYCPLSGYRSDQGPWGA